MENRHYFFEIKQANKNAFDKLFLAYYPQLCRFLLAFTSNKDDVEEVVQRMFVRLWENHKKLVQPDSEKAYLYKSVYHEFLKFSRHQKTRDGYHQDYLYFYEPDDDNREHLEEIKIYLNKAIQKLPARCKEIFILNKIEGLTQKEIAGLLDISVKTVEHQVAKAIHKLRDELKPIMHLLPAMVILAKLLK